MLHNGPSLDCCCDEWKHGEDIPFLQLGGDVAWYLWRGCEKGHGIPQLSF
jgi:hypothetical protein